MKKIFVSAFILIAFNNILQAQTPGETLANKIAQKMKDSLSLRETQKGQLYTINMNITNQKSAVRQRYVSSDSLGIKVQRVENTRDSLYSQVLTEQQFYLYKQKKKFLVNNN